MRQQRGAGQGNTAPPPTGRTYRQIVRENVFTFINNILFVLGLALVLVGRPLDALEPRYLLLVVAPLRAWLSLVRISWRCRLIDRFRGVGTA